MNRFKRYLSAEIKIEFKACLYFFAILFFYAVYQLVQGRFYTGIVQMAEMILTAYAMGYVQVFLLGNFEEAERIGKKELGASLLCMTVYTALSWLLGWYDRNTAATVLFFCLSGGLLPFHNACVQDQAQYRYGGAEPGAGGIQKPEAIA